MIRTTSPAADLISVLATANFVATNHLTNQVLQEYRLQAHEARVCLDVVRARIEDLLSGDHMPSTGALYRALYPDQALVERLVAEQLEQDRSR